MQNPCRHRYIHRMCFATCPNNFVSNCTYNTNFHLHLHRVPQYFRDPLKPPTNDDVPSPSFQLFYVIGTPITRLKRSFPRVEPLERRSVEKLDKETSRKRSQGYVPISAFRKSGRRVERGWWIHPFTDYAGTDSLFPRRRCSMIRRMALQPFLPLLCHPSSPSTPSTASTPSAKLNCVCQIRSGKSFLDITGFRNRHQAMSSDPAGFASVCSFLESA